MKTYDVTALGELLIDFTESGVSKQGHPLMEVNPGGAPCNLLSMLCRLEKKTNFIGKIGDDMFGDLLEDAVRSVGIGVGGLARDPKVNTTLAFVHTREDGDREFSFYRNPGADMMLSPLDVDYDLIRDTKIFHFGTLSMTHESNRSATFRALYTAKTCNALISFDPNIREMLWDDLNVAKKQMAKALKFTDILKISDNELVWFTGEKDLDKAIKLLRDEFPIPLILLSMGRDGSRAYQDDLMVEVPAFIQKQTIETTGAGDSFGGCVLGYLLDHAVSVDENGDVHLDKLTRFQIKEMLIFANAAASIVTTRKGALKAMPTRNEIAELILKKMY